MPVVLEQQAQVEWELGRQQGQQQAQVQLRDHFPRVQHEAHELAWAVALHDGQVQRQVLQQERENAISLELPLVQLCRVNYVDFRQSAAIITHQLGENDAAMNGEAEYA